MSIRKRNKIKKIQDPSKKGNSNYAKKKAFLRKNGGYGIDYPNKPWKS